MIFIPLMTLSRNTIVERSRDVPSESAIQSAGFCVAEKLRVGPKGGVVSDIPPKIDVRSGSGCVGTIRHYVRPRGDER